MHAHWEVKVIWHTKDYHITEVANLVGLVLINNLSLTLEIITAEVKQGEKP